MGKLSVGDVVLIPFPYADLTSFKKRPALVIGKAEFDNLILCQVTSKANTSKIATLIEDKDFEVGGLNLDSFVRPDKLFTMEKSIVESKLGQLKTEKMAIVKQSIRSIFE